MSLHIARLLDRTGRQILRLLQEDARISWSELGRRVGLSAPAAAERVHRLSDAGIISGFHAAIPLDKLGLSVTAFVMLTARTDKYPAVLAFCDRAPEVLECHHVSGKPSFVIKTATASVAHLDSLIAQMSRFGETSTLIALSSPVQKELLPLNALTNTPSAEGS